jgi:hypothetical protein
MLVMCAASWRSQAYMVEAVRGIVEPVRVATWTKPRARTKVQTTGWAWASVKVIAFKKGKALDLESEPYLDHHNAEPVMNGRRAELPAEVAKWMVAPFAVPGGLCLDPFAGSGKLLKAAEDCGMRAIGYELNASVTGGGQLTRRPYTQPDQGETGRRDDHYNETCPSCGLRS